MRLRHFPVLVLAVIICSIQGITHAILTDSPTASDPTLSPTQSPTTSDPTLSPTQSPTTSDPTLSPTTSDPTLSPTQSPTTSDPTLSPTQSPTTSDPTLSPTQSPTTSDPTLSPTQSPTTSDPTMSPTQSPTTSDPTLSPTQSPTTSDPTLSPTLSPTIGPKITCPVGQTVIYDDVGVEKTYTYDTSVFLVYHTNTGDPFAAVENIPLPTGTSHLYPAESDTPGADLGITVEVSKSQSTAISDEASGVIYQTISDGTGTNLGTNFVSGGDKFFLNQNYTITYTMTDFFGNLDTCTIDLYIVDLESPVITVCPTHVFQTDLNLSTYTASNVLVSGSTIPNVTATDNSGENIVDTALYMGLSYSESDEMVFALDSDGTSGVHDVTYTLTDTSGNSVSCTGTVTVEDVQVPFITCPNIAQVSFEDEHDDIVGLSGSIDGPVYDDQSPFTATYTNTEQATKLVFHTNKRANVATLCGNSGCTGVGPEQIVPNAVISDNSQNLYPNIVLSYTIKNGQADVTNSVFDISFSGGSILTFTAEDASGNRASCNMEVKIVDLERPRIRCPRNFVYFDPTNETLNTPDWQTTSGTPITPQPYNFHYISIDGASRIRVKWDDPLTYDNIQVNGDIGDTLSGRNIGAFVNGALSSYEKCDNAGPIDDTYAGGCVQVNPVQNELFQVRSATGGASGSATRSNNVYDITYSVQDSSGNSATCDFTVSLQVDCSSVFLGEIQKWSRTPAGSQSPPSNCSAGSTGVQTRVCKDNGLFGTEFPDDFDTTNCNTNNFNARSNAVLHLFPYTGVTRPAPPPDSRRTRAKRSEECENANPVDPCEGLTGDGIEYVQVTDPCDPQYIAVISSMNSIYGLSLKELESMIVYKICGESKEISVGQYLAGECLGAKEPTEYGQADPGTCYCDDLCVQYGDCCIDYEEYIGTFQTSSPSTSLPTTLPTQSPTRTPSGSPTVRVITSAPTAVPQSVFSESSYTASWETDASTADADASASDSSFTSGEESCGVYCNSNPGRRRRRQTSTSGSLTSEQVLELLRSTGAPFDDILGFPVITIPNRYVATGVVCENMKWKGDAKRLTSLVRQYIEYSNDGGGATISGGKNTLSPTPAPYTDVVVPRFLLNDSVDEAGNPIEAIENCPDLNTAVVRNKESSDCGPTPFFGHRDAYRCDYWNLSAACTFDEDLSFSDPVWESTCEKLCQQVSIQYPSTPCHAWTLDLSDPREQGVMCILSDEVPDWALEFSIGNATDLLDSIDTRLSELAGNLALAEANIRALVSTFPTKTPTQSGKQGGFQKGYTPPPSPAIPSNLLEAVQSIEDDIAYMTDLQSQTVTTIASLTGQLQFRPLSLVSQCFFKSGALDNSTLWNPEACDARLYQPTASPTSTPTSEPTMRPTEAGKGGKGGKGTYPPTISVPTNAPSSSEPTFGPTVFSCDIEAYKTAFFALTSSPTVAPTTSPTDTPTTGKGKGNRYNRRSVVGKSHALQKSAMSSTWQAKQSGAMARSGTFFVGLIALVVIIAYYRHKRKSNIYSRENDNDLIVVTGNASV